MQVCLSQHSKLAAAGLLLCARPAGDVNRLLQQRAVPRCQRVYEAELLDLLSWVSVCVCACVCVRVCVCVCVVGVGVSL